ncbi:MAG: hypothetical protein JJT76_17510 [Clostridiaceae bacterium]|nr:hypothetical protein [Clostridiaceae bacterium]
MNRGTMNQFLGDVKEDVEESLQRNKEFKTVEAKMEKRLEKLEASLPKEMVKELYLMQEEHVEYTNIMQDAAYLKGIQDGVKFMTFFSSGDVIDKFTDFEGKKVLPHIARTIKDIIKI